MDLEVFVVEIVFLYRIHGSIVNYLY